jgi:two-component system, NtrC family, response regulator AtoC
VTTSTRPRSVLVIDDDERTRQTLTDALRRGYRVLGAASGETALGLLMREEVDVVLLEVRLPGISGFEVLRILRENYPLVAVIMVSAVAEVGHAVQAIKEGAFHFVTKDATPDTIRSTVDLAVEHQGLNREVLRLRSQVSEATDREFIVGTSPATRAIVDVVHRVARLSATVLILGESGTGKELLARLIHRESDRPDGPFVPVNLAAIPRDLVESVLFGHEKGSFTGALRQQIGKFELASGGTLFLDEIGDLRLELQAKLLRAIQEGEIERIGGARAVRTDFRLIAATNADLDKAVQEGRFREDLYYRLNVVPLKVPPLRDRAEDVPELARFFLQRYSTRFRKTVSGIADSAMRMLQAYWWPGNIRELENLIERIVAITDKDWITDEDLPLDFVFAQLDREPQPDTSLFEQATRAFERNFILRALEKNGWNVTGTARHLGLPLSTLKFKMDRLEVRELAKRIRGN